MNVKNLFVIEELLECMADNYCHVKQFIGTNDVDTLLGGIKEDESDNLLRKWKGPAIIIWFNSVEERENFWTMIYRSVEIQGNEKLRVWFYTSKKDEPIMFIPIEF